MAHNSIEQANTIMSTASSLGAASRRLQQLSIDGREPASADVVAQPAAELPALLPELWGAIARHVPRLSSSLQ